MKIMDRPQIPSRLVPKQSYPNRIQGPTATDAHKFRIHRILNVLYPSNYQSEFDIPENVDSNILSGVIAAIQSYYNLSPKTPILPNPPTNCSEEFREAYNIARKEICDYQKYPYMPEDSMNIGSIS